jgi:hypothetical protein
MRGEMMPVYNNDKGYQGPTINGRFFKIYAETPRPGIGWRSAEIFYLTVLGRTYAGK